MDEDLCRRLRRVKMVAMDVDGVLTDGRAFYGTNGFEGLFFNVQDGSGIKYLHRAGIETAIITGRSVPAVQARAEVLDIERVYQGVKFKVEAYAQLKADTGVQDDEVCFIGDDLPDVPVLRRVGLPVAVANARPEVKIVARIITVARGGDGAVREVAEMILKARGDWEALLKRYFEG